MQVKMRSCVGCRTQYIISFSSVVFSRIGSVRITLARACIGAFAKINGVLIKPRGFSVLFPSIFKFALSA